MTCVGGRKICEKLPLVFCQNLSLFLFCISLCSNLILLDCLGIMGMYITKFARWRTQIKVCLKILLQLNYLVPLMSPIEKKWEECFGLKFFDREWRHIKRVFISMMKIISLGMLTHWNYQVSGLPTS